MQKWAWSKFFARTLHAIMSMGPLNLEQVPTPMRPSLRTLILKEINTAERVVWLMRLFVYRFHHFFAMLQLLVYKVRKCLLTWHMTKFDWPHTICCIGTRKCDPFDHTLSCRGCVRGSGHKTNAPIKVVPYFPPPGIGGD